MPKTYNSEKVEAEFDKLPLHEQIEKYHLLGEVIHKKIEKRQQETEELKTRLGKK